MPPPRLRYTRSVHRWATHNEGRPKIGVDIAPAFALIADSFDEVDRAVIGPPAPLEPGYFSTIAFAPARIDSHLGIYSQRPRATCGDSVVKGACKFGTRGILHRPKSTEEYIPKGSYLRKWEVTRWEENHPAGNPPAHAPSEKHGAETERPTDQAKPAFAPRQVVTSRGHQGTSPLRILKQLSTAHGEHPLCVGAWERFGAHRSAASPGSGDVARGHTPTTGRHSVLVRRRQPRPAFGATKNTVGRSRNGYLHRDRGDVASP